MKPCWHNQDIEKHPFCPIFSKNSKILILGSFPSLDSKRFGFYYANRHNRFWPILSKIFNVYIPTSSNTNLSQYQIIQSQMNFLLAHNIALWDCVMECRRKVQNASDLNLEVISVNPIMDIVQQSNIEAIFCSGIKAMNIFKKYIVVNKNLHIHKLPSTSPRNNRYYNLNDILKEWGRITKYLI